MLTRQLCELLVPSVVYFVSRSASMSGLAAFAEPRHCLTKMRLRFIPAVNRETITGFGEPRQARP